MDSLRQYKQKVYSNEKKLSDPYLSRFYRHFSLPLSHLLCRTSVTPNQITLLQIFAGLYGCYLVYSPLNQFSFFWGVAILHLAYVLDCVDGEIARYKNMQSIQGVFLDKYAHAIVMQAIFVSVGAYFASYPAVNAYSEVVVCISWLASFSTFMPAYRLVLTTSESFLRKTGESQYQVDTYPADRGADRGKHIEATTGTPLLSRVSVYLKQLARGLGGADVNYSRAINMAKQIFRHVSYLFILTVIAVLELSTNTYIYGLLIWSALCVALIAKEVTFVAIALKTELIKDRYYSYFVCLERERKQPSAPTKSTN